MKRRIVETLGPMDMAPGPEERGSMGYLAKQSRAEIARLTAERDTARGLCVDLESEVARLREAAANVVNEYDSHGMRGSHQECAIGGACSLPRDVSALRAALCDHAPTLGHVPRPGWLTVCPTCGAEMRGLA